MDLENIRTLSSTFPHVLEALLKRMTRVERYQVLKEFEDKYPKEFKTWFTPDVQRYFEGLGN
jgi:hypothetical protein